MKHFTLLLSLFLSINFALNAQILKENRKNTNFSDKNTKTAIKNSKGEVYLLDLQNNYRWDENTKTWAIDPYSKEEYTYDTDGNQTLLIGSKWDENTSSWLNNWKEESTYDASGNETSYSEYSWDTDSWIGEWKTTTTYNTSGNETLNTSYNWDTNTSTWGNSELYEYTYDENGNKTSDTENSWDTNTSSWVGSYKSEYIYSIHDINTLVENSLSITNVTIFPNPVANYLNIENSKVEISSIAIYNMQGKVVLTQSVNTSKTNVNVNFLQNGIYTILINSKNGIEKQKFIKN